MYQQYLFDSSYYGQLSVDIKIKNLKIKTSFVNPKGPKVQANQTAINFMIFILIFVENCLIRCYT